MAQSFTQQLRAIVERINLEHVSDPPEAPKLLNFGGDWYLSPAVDSSGYMTAHCGCWLAFLLRDEHGRVQGGPQSQLVAGFWLPARLSSAERMMEDLAEAEAIIRHARHVIDWRLARMECIKRGEAPFPPESQMCTCHSDLDRYVACDVVDECGPLPVPEVGQRAKQKE